MKLVLPELRSGGKRNRYMALFGPWVLLFIFAVGVIVLFVVVTTRGTGVAAGWEDAFFYCDPNGKVRYKYSVRSYDRISPYWDDSLFLSVNMGFHGLNFAQAKAIDVCFDLVVGRGSQFVVALATYPILRRGVLRAMEVREFSLALLLPFFLERLSANSLWALLANMRSRGNKPKTDDQTDHIRFRNAKVRIDWRVILVFLVGCYILALPTFMSVMTSYQPRSAPFISGQGDTNYVSTENLTLPAFVIPDGSSVGLSTNYPVDDGDPEMLAACSEYYDAKFGKVNELWNDIFSAYLTALEGFEPSSGLISYRARVAEHEAFFNETRDSFPLTQNVTDSRGPPLWSFTLWPRNLTLNAYQARFRTSAMQSMIVIGNTTYDFNGTLPLLDNNLDPSNTLETTTTWFAYDNVAFYPSQITAYGSCLPANDYIWGFSSLMLFTFCMITIAVTLLLITLHYDAYCNSAADRYKFYVSPYRDVLDLAEEIRVHYGSAEVAEMPGKTLDKAMREDPVTTGLETATLHRSRGFRWKQGKASKRSSTWDGMRKRSKVTEGQTIEAEESLMSMGFDTQGSELEMGKLPAKVMTRSTTTTSTL